MVESPRARPGYQKRKRADGSVAHYWNPSRASTKAPPGLPIRRIKDGTHEDEIARLCRIWTDELIVDIENIATRDVYAGTVASLVSVYRTHPESPYHALKHVTRVHDYEPALRLIADTVGKRAVTQLDGSDFRRWFREWGSEGRHRRAHGAIRKLRAVFSFGAEQRLPGCSQAREILSLIRFKLPPARTIRLEYEHARAICEKAIELGRPSIALTQAIQWDTALRRIHIIGEWIPVKDGAAGGIVRGGTMWRGPTATDISGDLVFTPPYSSNRKVATSHDLSVCDLVGWVLQHIELPRMGPLIVNEDTGLPWRDNYYSRAWRAIADAVGVPTEVRSMDTRAGALSETEEATGSLDATRKLAGHTSAKTTLGYVRNDGLENSRTVARARSRLRDSRSS